MVPPGRGTRTRKPTDLPRTGRGQGLSCHGPLPESQAEDGEAGWLEEYIGYMQDHVPRLSQVILGRREQGHQDIRETQGCVVLTASHFGDARWSC